MYIPSFIVQSLHEDRIRDAQRTAQIRVISDNQSVSLFSRISQMLHIRGQQAATETPEMRAARHAHAL
ncbi:MAG: hypothetical protein ABI700_11740 [Chloroflexota bacterium]